MKQLLIRAWFNDFVHFFRLVWRSRQTKSILYFLVVLRLRLTKDLDLPSPVLSKVLRSSSVSSYSENNEAKVKCFVGFRDESRFAKL